MDFSIVEPRALSPGFVEVIAMVSLANLRGKVHLPIDLNPAILRCPSKVVSSTRSSFLTLPAEIQMNIFSNLEFLDQSTLAVTCKHMGRTYSNLTKSQATVPGRNEIRKKTGTSGDPNTNLVEKVVTKRPPRATRLQQLDYLLRFHGDGVLGAMPGYRLCLTCATFKPARGIWGGDTSYLKKKQVNNESVIRGPRCPKCAQIANKAVFEARAAWRVAKKFK